MSKSTRKLTRPLNRGHKTAGLCSYVANFNLLFCAVYGKRYKPNQFNQPPKSPGVYGRAQLRRGKEVELTKENIESWEADLKSKLFNVDSIEYTGDGECHSEISFSWKKGEKPPIEVIKRIIPEADIDEMLALASVQTIDSVEKEIIILRCSCFRDCSGGRCWTECYYCYPGNGCYSWPPCF